MTEKVQFVDFGAPEQFGTHVFRVEIPAARTEPVRIIEDYGYRGLEDGSPRIASFCLAPSGPVLPRAPDTRSTIDSRPPRSLSVGGILAPISWSVSSARSSASSPGQPRQLMTSRFP
jgi:hypothetical protein